MARVAGYELRVAGYAARVAGSEVARYHMRGGYFFVWIKRDTHENFIDEIKVFLEIYDELGAKINKYIQYVEKEWR